MGVVVLTVQSIYDHLRNSPKMPPLMVKLILSMMEPCKKSALTIRSLRDSNPVWQFSTRLKHPKVSQPQFYMVFILHEATSY